MQAEKFHLFGDGLKGMTSEGKSVRESVLGRSKDGDIVEIPRDNS